jgi:hypothetical protein
MSATPISDLIELYQESPSAEHFDALVDCLASSPVGVHLFGAVQSDTERNLVADGETVSLASTMHGDGKSRILAFADPREFLHRFGPKCNGEMPGQALFEVVLHNSDCHGILLNSARAETSVVIPRSEIASLQSHVRRIPSDQAVTLSAAPTPRWWEFWK